MQAACSVDCEGRPQLPQDLGWATGPVWLSRAMAAETLKGERKFQKNKEAPVNSHPPSQESRRHFQLPSKVGREGEWVYTFSCSGVISVLLHNQRGTEKLYPKYLSENCVSKELLFILLGVIKKQCGRDKKKEGYILK